MMKPQRYTIGIRMDGMNAEGATVSAGDFPTDTGTHYRCADIDPLLDERARMQCGLAGMYCPESAGFEGPDTFPACGSVECVVCGAKRALGLSVDEAHELGADDE